MRLFGTDPELFAVLDGKIVPPIATEKVGVTRIGTLKEDDPDYHPVYYYDGDIRIIGDGAAFEFNVPPVETPEEMFHWYSLAKKILSKLLPNNLEIVAKAAMPFDLKSLAWAFYDPENNKRLAWSCRFGCDPQENAYFGGFTKEIDATHIRHRYAGGHFHISDTEMDLQKIRIPLIRTLDQTLGIACLFNSPYPEAELIRQEFYGVPGNFRRQNYGNVLGIEYRTPSVSWLENLETVELVFELSNRVLNLFQNFPDKARELHDKYNEKSCKAILTYNKALGKELMTTFGEY